MFSNRKRFRTFPQPASVPRIRPFPESLECFPRPSIYPSVKAKPVSSLVLKWKKKTCFHIIIFIKCDHKFAIRGCQTDIYTIQDGTTTPKVTQCVRQLPYDALWKMVNGILRAVATPTRVYEKKKDTWLKVPFVSFCADNPCFVLSVLTMSQFCFAGLILSRTLIFQDCIFAPTIKKSTFLNCSLMFTFFSQVLIYSEQEDPW